MRNVYFNSFASISFLTFLWPSYYCFKARHLVFIIKKDITAEFKLSIWSWSVIYLKYSNIITNSQWLPHWKWNMCCKIKFVLPNQSCHLCSQKLPKLVFEDFGFCLTLIIYPQFSVQDQANIACCHNSATT